MLEPITIPIIWR